MKLCVTLALEEGDSADNYAVDIGNGIVLTPSNGVVHFKIPSDGYQQQKSQDQQTIISLRDQLDTASATVSALNSDKAALQTEIDSLRGQLESVNAKRAKDAAAATDEKAPAKTTSK